MSRCDCEDNPPPSMAGKTIWVAPGASRDIVPILDVVRDLLLVGEVDKAEKELRELAPPARIAVCERTWYLDEAKDVFKGLYRIYGTGIQGSKLMFADPDDPDTELGEEHHHVVVSSSTRNTMKWGSSVIFAYEPQGNAPESPHSNWPLRELGAKTHLAALKDAGIEYVIPCIGQKFGGLPVVRNPPRTYRPQRVVARLEKDDRPEFAGKTIGGPEDVIEGLADFIGHRANEVFVVIFINVRNGLVGFMELTEANPVGVGVNPQGIFAAALAANAAAIITVHQHPSGEVSPSVDDQRLWARLRDGAEILGLVVLDNFVVTPSRFYSESDGTGRDIPRHLQRSVAARTKAKSEES